MCVCVCISTESGHRVEEEGQGGEGDVVWVGVEGVGEVGGQPRHQSVVAPVHAEVCAVDGHQTPVTHVLRPVHPRHTLDTQHHRTVMNKCDD